MNVSLKPLRVGALVYVEWEDSVSGSEHWTFIDAEKEADDMAVKSVGWVTKIGKRAVEIVPHIAEDPNPKKRQGAGDFTIPFSAIRKIRRLNAI